MNDGLPKQYQLAYSPDVIQSRVAAIAQPIARWAEEIRKNTGQDLLAVCVLRGAVHFFSDLLRALPLSIEPAYGRTWHYSVESNSQNESGIRVALEEIPAAGRSLLLVDDICDTGKTLLRLTRIFTELGSVEVRTAVLIHRQMEQTCCTPDWSCFEYRGPEWFVGYGLDDRNRYSNLPGVYTVVPSGDR